MAHINNKLRFSFYRDYQRYTGGHQKFRDYLEHTAAISDIECHLFAKSYCTVMPDLFRNIPNVVRSNTYEPDKADVVFLAGMDWNTYLPKMRRGQQVINLIQHVRHGDKNNPLFRFLEHEALRICVSEEVRLAISPYANGDCVAIKMGHDMPDVDAETDLDLYILGKKNPQFATEIEQWAHNNDVSVHADIGLVARDAVFTNFARARVALVLPNPTEGFFLPGIEAMALSDRVVVPDCVGNRGYCKPNMNITLCGYEKKACISAIEEALTRLKKPVHKFEKFRGVREARSYTMTAERDAYHELLFDRVLK